MSLRILWIVMLLSTMTARVYPADAIAFYHYGLDQGLNETRVKSITQDSTGFIWLAGDYSITRFDGHEFKSYTATEHTPRPWGWINTLHTSTDGKIWIGSTKGFAVYNALHDKFSAPPAGWEDFQVNDFANLDNNRMLIATNQGIALFDMVKQTTTWITGPSSQYPETKNIPPDIRSVTSLNNEIWFSAFPSGVFKMNLQTKTVAPVEQLDTLKLDQMEVQQLQITDNHLFICSILSGFYSYHIEKQEIKSYNPEGLEYNAHCFSNIGDSIVWLATDNGLIRINPLNDNYTRYTNVPGNPLSLQRTALSFVFADKNHNLWISTGVRGIDFGLLTAFNHMPIMPEEPYSLSQKEVTCISSDYVGNLWIGYEAGFIEKNSFNPVLKTRYSILSPSGRSLGSIFAIFHDKKGRAWTGGWRSGLFVLEPNTSRFREAGIRPREMAERLERMDIRNITEDRHGNLWIAAHGTGLVKYNPEDSTAFIYKSNSNDSGKGISNNYIFDLCFDHNNKLWISSAYGITCMDPEKERFTSFFRNANDTLSLPSDMIYTVHCDVSGNIWTGTNNGLAIFVPELQKFRTIKTSKNSRFQNISAIESVLPGEVWVSTKSGLIRIDYSPENPMEPMELNYFNSSNGLISSVYFDRSSAVLNNQTLYFGGNEGVDYFNPQEKILDKKYSPKPVVTEISVFGKTISPYLINMEKNIPYVMLNYDQRMLSFRFTSVDFAGDVIRRFRYRLEGFDSQWIYPQDERVATYTNLRQGNYLFDLQAMDKNGNWTSEGSSVKVTIEPPFWATFPFITFALIIFLVMLILIFRIHSARIRRKARELEILVQERTSELMVKNIELERANQTKSKFFSIISHDLKSPFSGLIGLLELLNDPDGLPEDKKKEMLTAAYNSARNTFNLLENLLLWALSHTNEIKYQPSDIDLRQLISKNIALTQEQALQKEITIHHDLSGDLRGFADGNMIDTVIRNILNNAVKFTLPGGHIFIKAEPHYHEVLVQVADTGIGLNGTPHDELFSATGKSRPGTKGEAGTGLGLLISKEFILKNKGKIWVSPNQPKGTVFHFTIPKPERN